MELDERRCGTCGRWQKGNEPFEVLETRRYREHCCTVDPKKGKHENDQQGCLIWTPREGLENAK